MLRAGVATVSDVRPGFCRYPRTSPQAQTDFKSLIDLSQQPQRYKTWQLPSLPQSAPGSDQLPLEALGG